MADGSDVADVREIVTGRRFSLCITDSEIVTEFLLSTCRLQPTRHDVQTVVFSAAFASRHPPNDPEADHIPLISGSSVELYIKPMLSCVEDIDIMYHLSTLLAIPAGYSAPTELPAEFYSRVTVFEFIDSQYPGYVYLKTRYMLTESNDDGRYNAVLYGRQLYANLNTATDARYHGPALTQPACETLPSFDIVQCVRCLSWPTQAADWPTRHRKYHWPDSATVDRVVSNGCDVVHAAHRLCRQDEWDSKYQWRLSFSRAEVVLLNSWMPVQQIIYHMLRVFVKTERLTRSDDEDSSKVISNYNIKTLMLWACELQPESWWITDRNFVRICVELLHTLASWLTDARCSHYFINNCNVMDTVRNAEIIVEQLMSVTESWLIMWFAKNYILKCAQLCPDNVSWLFDDVSTSVKLQAAASAIVVCRRNTALVDLWDVYQEAVFRTSVFMTECSQRIRSCVYYMNELKKLHQRLPGYYTACVFLCFSLTLTKHDLTIESLVVLSLLCGESVGRRRYSSQPGSVLLLSQAAKLMKVVANSSRSTVQLIEIELSKAYLYRALRCKDSDNDSIYCLANVYLAILYYTTRQYQTAIDHCTLVTRSQGHSQCSSHVVQRELLPKIDDNIDNALGLAVFYHYVRIAALNKKQAPHISVFTTELFAHYLLIRLSAAKHNIFVQIEEVDRRYRKNVSDRQELLTTDVCLWRLIDILRKPPFSSKLLIYQRQPPSANPVKLNTSELVELLQQSAGEHLTTFRQFMAREFGSVATIVTTDFEAMYAYKRGDYQLCLQLSTQNVHALLYARRWTDVYTFPAFIQLLDDDIVSLSALTLIVNPECRGLSRNVGITQLTLSLYLMTQCQLKLRHSATQLAQTLDYIQVTQRRHPAASTLDKLTLKLTRRKALLYLVSAVNEDSLQLSRQ